MKAIIEIDDNEGCVGCPYCQYKDLYDSYRSEDSGNGETTEGFYCKKSMKFISKFYNLSDKGILIPSWCELCLI